MEINIKTQANAYYLIGMIVDQISRDELIALIQWVDAQLVEDWDFTKEMFEYFRIEMEKKGE